MKDRIFIDLLVAYFRTFFEMIDVRKIDFVAMEHFIRTKMDQVPPNTTLVAICLTTEHIMRTFLRINARPVEFDPAEEQKLGIFANDIIDTVNIYTEHIGRQYNIDVESINTDHIIDYIDTLHRQSTAAKNKIRHNMLLHLDLLQSNIEASFTTQQITKHQYTTVSHKIKRFREAILEFDLSALKTLYQELQSEHTLVNVEMARVLMRNLHNSFKQIETKDNGLSLHDLISTQVELQSILRLLQGLGIEYLIDLNGNSVHDVMTYYRRKGMSGDTHTVHFLITTLQNNAREAKNFVAAILSLAIKYNSDHVFRRGHLAAHFGVEDNPLTTMQRRILRGIGFSLELKLDVTDRQLNLMKIYVAQMSNNEREKFLDIHSQQIRDDMQHICKFAIALNDAVNGFLARVVKPDVDSMSVAQLTSFVAQERHNLVFPSIDSDDTMLIEHALSTATIQYCDSLLYAKSKSSPARYRS